MSKSRNTVPEQERISKLVAEKSKHGIKLDIACGAHKQGDDWVGIDYLPYNGVVDIIHNMEITPWPLPADCVQTSLASHIFEHINPHFGDPRTEALANGLVQKEIITQKEKDDWMGQSGPAFLRVMDEIWRITKPGGQLAFTVPYSGSPGDFWDPTHVNHINEMTLAYFDPEDRANGYNFWKFYQPKPWKVEQSFWHVGGNLEALLVKRPDVYRMESDKEYSECPNKNCGTKKTNERYVINDERKVNIHTCYGCGTVWPAEIE